MINKKNKSYKFCVICLVSVCLLAFLYLGEKIDGLNVICEHLKKTKIKDIVNIVAILSGVSGILVGTASIRISNMGAVKEYFQQGDNKENAEARKEIYHKINNNIRIDKNDVAAASVVSFFHFWGAMVKKHYLPVWVFDSASGYAVIKLYEGLQEMIEERRKDNSKYGEYFEWLYYKIKGRTKENVEYIAKTKPAVQHVNETSFLTENELKSMGFKNVGRDVRISRKASFYGKENICIGDHVRIDDFCVLSGNIQIGSYVHISSYTSLIAGNKGIYVGDFATISLKCSIFSKSDDFSGMAMTNPMVPDKYRHIDEGEVILSKYVIVGSGSVILPNVALGEGVAIGAMSLVKENIEPWVICAGIPCKVIKNREKQIKALAEQFESESDIEWKI